MIFKSVDVSKYFYTIDVFVFLYMLFKIVLQKKIDICTSESSQNLNSYISTGLYQHRTSWDILLEPVLMEKNPMDSPITVLLLFLYISEMYIYILYPCLVLFGIFCLCFLPLYRHCLLIFQNDLITIFSLLNPPLYWL